MRQNRVESWVKDFDLGVADQRTLYLASADLLRSSRVRTAGRSHAPCAETQISNAGYSTCASEGFSCQGNYSLRHTGACAHKLLGSCSHFGKMPLPGLLASQTIRTCSLLQSRGLERWLTLRSVLQHTSSTSDRAFRWSTANATPVCAQKKAAGAKDAFKLTLKALATFEVRAQRKQ